MPETRPARFLDFIAGEMKQIDRRTRQSRDQNRDRHLLLALLPVADDAGSRTTQQMPRAQPVPEHRDEIRMAVHIIAMREDQRQVDLLRSKFGADLVDEVL